MLINPNKLTMAPDGITVFLIKQITSFLLRFPLKNITPMQIHAGITKANTSKKLYQLNLDCNVCVQRIREAIIRLWKNRTRPIVRLIFKLWLLGPRKVL